MCSNCSTENPEGAKFCMSCGSPLAAACPACGTENPPGAKFCIECGAALAGEEAPARAPAVPVRPTPPAADARPPEERRVATVLFADLSGYTAVAERMDPETTKSLVNRALQRLGQEVVRYGGTVDKYIGDNVMAVFGAPVAHEDDPERAVRAGIAMQAAMGEINDGLAQNPTYGDASFLLRVGINTGEVLAGSVGDEYTVIGDAVNVAARVERLTRETGDVVLVTEATRCLLTDGSENPEQRGHFALKGVSDPVPIYALALQVDESLIRSSRTAQAEA